MSEPAEPAKKPSSTGKVRRMLRRCWRGLGYYACIVVTSLKKVDALITAIATVLLALITAILALIAYWQYTDTTLREALVASNRAWIASSGISVTGQIDDDKDFTVNVYYTNVGKGPALKMNQYFSVGTAPIPTNDVEPISAGLNATCDGLRPKAERTVVFPSTQHGGWINTTIGRAVFLTPAVKANKAAIYLQGCLSYETMQQVHKTWFCYAIYRNGTFATQNVTVLCADGNGAD
jgi:hypothetical protein